MTRTVGRTRKGSHPDAFLKDKKSGEFEKAGPRVDVDADFFAKALSKIRGREKTGFVLNWLPPWAKKNKIDPFSFYFYEDGLALDVFNRNGGEMDALADDFNPAQREQITKKTAFCQEYGVSYMVLGPDDEADETQIAAKVGRTTYRKGSNQVSRTSGKPSDDGDGIAEEGD